MSKQRDTVMCGMKCVIGEERSVIGKINTRSAVNSDTKTAAPDVQSNPYVC